MSFEELMNDEKFSEAADAFDQLTTEQKATTLKGMHYRAREFKQPVAVSILRRQLHDDKQFEDFYKAWLPREQDMSPTQIGGTTYHQYFECPLRVINAVNLADEKDIVSIGLVWCEKEQLMQYMENSKDDASNTARADSIESVADKKSVEIFFTQADTRLGN